MLEREIGGYHLLGANGFCHAASTPPTGVHRPAPWTMPWAAWPMAVPENVQQALLQATAVLCSAAQEQAIPACGTLKESGNWNSRAMKRAGVV